MRKRTSVYTFEIQGDVSNVEKIMQSFILAKGFRYIEKGSETFYEAGDLLLGYKCLSYEIVGRALTINAWTTNNMILKFPVEKRKFNILSNIYRNELLTLFSEIQKLNVDDLNNNKDNTVNASSPIGQSVNQNNINNNQVTQKFKNEQEKKQELMCEIGFWLSILDFVVAFFGMIMGVMIYNIIVFYFAAQGLKTKKSGKATASIVLAIISIIIAFIMAIVNNI